MLRGSEGLGLKGGSAVRFWKGKGSKKEANMYRQILLISNLAKCMHQSLRPMLRDHFVRHTPELQLGGKPGCNVVYGAHVTRSFLRWQRQIRGSCFILFMDIASAYYSVVRELVAKHGNTTGHSACLKDINLPEEDLKALAQHASKDSALKAAGASPYLEALAQRLTDSTWFVLQQDTIPVLTSRGTRPGSSWADLLFSTIVGRILKRRDDLQEGLAVASSTPQVQDDGKITLAPCSEGAPSTALSDLIWADDIATMRVVDRALVLPVGIKTTVGTSCDAFAEHGFQLSYGRNKTAVLAQPAGQGAKAARQHLFGSPGLKGTICAMRENSGPAKVPLVCDYKHLGTQVAVGGGMRQELSYRIAQARAAFSEHRRKVFKSPGVPLKRKAFILKAMVLPKLLYGCGAWPPLGAKEFQSFAGALWSMFRQLLCIPHTSNQHVTAVDTLALLELPGPTVTLHVHRILYLGQLVRTGPKVLWTLLRLDRPYAEALAKSARWLYQWVYRTCPLPDPDTHWDSWVELFRTSGNRLKGWVKRAQALEVRRYQTAASLDGLYRSIRALTADDKPPPQQHLICREVCIPCRKLFNSRVAWSCHAQRVHGYRTQAYLIIARNQKSVVKFTRAFFCFKLMGPI